MDDTTTSAQHTTAAIDLMGPITVVHVVLMIALAVAAVLVIWWGSVLARRRRLADKQVAEDREIADEAGATAPPSADVAVTAEGQPDAQPATEETPVARPPVEQTPPPAPTPAATELTQLKGLGPKLAATLAELGYTRVEQIAALTPAEAEALDARLGAFQGRMARDRWIEQAKLLAAGDRAAYEAQFGKL